MSLKALITGITGQDGSYLAEFLLARGYEVHGAIRRVALEQPDTRLQRIERIRDKITLHSANLDSFASLFHIFSKHHFDEVYHLAAQSYVAESFADGFSTMSTNVNGTHYVLAAIQDLQPRCRFYFAGTSEMFGKPAEYPQSERTPFHPRSPYGVSKVTGFHLTMSYRETHSMFCCSGILFNHESPRRGLEFVTRKISRGAAKIALGLTNELPLGNLDAERDWGHAADYVEAMHAMLQQPEPDDYVIATGEVHSVRNVCEIAFDELGLDYRKYVHVDQVLHRPNETSILVGDASKARKQLGWAPTRPFNAVIKEMVRADYDSLHAMDQPRNLPVRG